MEYQVPMFSCVLQFSYFSLGWADTPAVRSSLPDFHRRMRTRLRTPYQGADTLIWLCLSPNSRKEKSGNFFQDRKAVSKHLPMAWTHNSESEANKFIGKLNEIRKDLQ